MLVRPSLRMPLCAGDRPWRRCAGQPPPSPTMLPHLHALPAGGPHRLGAEQSGKQARHAEIHIEPIPVQPESEPENFDLCQFSVAGVLKSLRAARRKGE